MKHRLIIAIAAVLIPAAAAPPALAQSDDELVRRLAGTDRIATAVAVSAAGFPEAEAVDTVVLATAGAYPDALSGAPLAALLGAPILLTGADGLHPEAATEILRLAPARAILLGGSAALSEQVEADLAALGVEEIARRSGATRFGTAADVAAEVAAAADGPLHVYIVEGLHADPARGWPDAVVVSALAALTARPILLVEAGRVPAETAAALEALGVARATIVGGRAAVSESVEQQLKAASIEVDRIAGPTRYETSYQAGLAALEEGADPQQLWLATGSNWPDALAAGPAAAAAGAVLLLVNGSDLAASPGVEQWIEQHSGARLTLLGGTAAISAQVENALRALIGAPPLDPPPTKPPVPPPAPAGFAMTELPPLVPGGESVAHAVGDGGHIVGYATGGGAHRAVLWSGAGEVAELAGLGGSETIAHGVNSHGQAVGYSMDAGGVPRAVLWDSETATATDIGGFGGASFAYAISDAGHVVGASHTGPGFDGDRRAFLWTADGGIVDVGHLGGDFTQAHAVNRHGHAVGESYSAEGRRRAFRWVDGDMVDLGSLGGDTAIANGISDTGVVVGESRTAAGLRGGFVWTQASGMTALAPLSSGNACSATAISAAGQIVGYCDGGPAPDGIGRLQHAVLWEAADRSPLELGALVGDSAALAINASRWIVGSGDFQPDSSAQRALVWR